MQNITMSQMLKVIGVTKSTFMKTEEALALRVPRNQKGHREFPADLVSHLQVLQDLAEAREQDLSALAADLVTLRLQLPLDAYGVPSADDYLQNYLQSFEQELAEIGLSLRDFVGLETQLELALPKDQRGNRCLNRDWRRYLQTVQEKMAQGKNAYWVVYNIPTPNQVRPQLAHASAYNPEY